MFSAKSKKCIALILSALMLSSSAVLASCSGSGNTDTPDTSTPATSADAGTTAAETTEAVTTQDPRALDELPTDLKDYDGYTFTVLSYDFDASKITWKIVDIYTEEENGERVNDAVFARNLKMEERFGVKVQQDLRTDPEAVARQSVNAGDDFALFQGLVQKLSGMAIQGLMLDMKKMEYINPDKVWWDKTANDALELMGRSYYLIGDSQINAKRATWTVLFNKKLVADAGVPNPYDAVKSGKWTLDLLEEYSRKIAKDANGDGEMKWGEDVFGLALQNEIVLPLMLGTGETIIKIHEDGTYEYDLGSERNMAILERVWKLLNTDNSYIINCNDYDGMANQWVEYRALFMADQFGFYMCPLGTVPLVGGDMQSDFGILPFPKMFEDQTEYYSTFQYNNANGIAALKNTSDTKRTGLLTEAYTMFAHDTILPAYYDYTLTLRAARDTESGEMLDIIFARRNLDVSLAFNDMTNIQTLLQQAVTAKSFTFASTEASKRKSFRANIEKIVKQVNKIEE